MTNFTHLIFDLDGTLINSKIGLLNSLDYMLEQMNVDVDGAAIVDQLIGPPIQDGLKNVLGFDDRQVNLGVKLFREYYSQQGLYEGELYPGVLELLEELFQQGKQLYVATSKRDEFAHEVLRSFELDRYLVDAQGAGNGDKHSKAELITRLMDRNQIMPSEKVVMIGDTKYDLIGGQANEISTIAVGYGFGNSAELKELNPTFFVEEVEELFELLV
ncbi:HAD hydrolase-like protein [Sunxiuqinia indica]|uniref:HAD hydrolase-like protein n=1 Tax=Sunxiuqinia indica TaxID=2692584 RepID=UPI001357107B|nr:HAD hydrolase-like protein [Sunxiuqinia indica]